PDRRQLQIHPQFGRHLRRLPSQVCSRINEDDRQTLRYPLSGPEHQQPEFHQPLRRNVLLVQLPIPPAGPTEIVGNVPLAAGYLKLLARQRGLEQDYDIQIFPPPLANSLSDRGIVAAILQRQPWLVGFTCYLWNIDRTIW